MDVLDCLVMPGCQPDGGCDGSGVYPVRPPDCLGHRAVLVVRKSPSCESGPRVQWGHSWDSGDRVRADSQACEVSLAIRLVWRPCRIEMREMLEFEDDCTQ